MVFKNGSYEAFPSSIAFMRFMLRNAPRLHVVTDRRTTGLTHKQTTARLLYATSDCAIHTTRCISEEKLRKRKREKRKANSNEKSSSNSVLEFLLCTWSTSDPFPTCGWCPSKFRRHENLPALNVKLLQISIALDGRVERSRRCRLSRTPDTMFLDRFSAQPLEPSTLSESADWCQVYLFSKDKALTCPPAGHCSSLHRRNTH